MQLKHVTRLGFSAFFLAWCFDQLFWQKAPGISFFIFVLLCLGAGIALTWGEKLRPAVNSLLLVIPILFFAGMTFLRQEPFTLLVDYGLALGCMLLLSLTWLGGRWWRYSLSDYIANALRWVGDVLVKPFPVFWSGRKPHHQGDEPDTGTAKRSVLVRTLLSVLLGLLLALPVVFLLARLLAEADPVFSQQLNQLLRLIDIEKLDEYLFRLFYISIGAHLLSGVFLYALSASQGEKVSAGEKSWLSPFLGWVEAATLLACVDLLFAFFVGIQFRYFFGGQANINVEGFTYSDYARRGFGELVAVAFISLLLLFALSAITRREERHPRRVFSGLGITLVALVAVILISAFQRLQLYEIAYGFSRLRTYTHVFMIWLGLLLLATALLEALNQLRYFALAALIASIGFGVTVNLVNVDGFIARQNISRAAQGARLDRGYLISLSEDAVPVLFEHFDSSQLSPDLQDQVGAVLACWAAMQPDTTERQPWPSFHWARQRARALYQSHQAELERYPVRRVDYEWRVTINGVEKSCWEQQGH